jgi:hypothetical protein
MNFDGTDTLSGTPLIGDLGTNLITIVLNDSMFISTNIQNVWVTNNVDPYMTSIPDGFAPAGAYYTYTAAGTDDLGDAVTIDIISKPAWLSWDNGTDTLSGIPALGDTGSNEFVFQISDGVNVVTNAQYVTVPGSQEPIIILEFESNLLDTSFHGNVHDAVELEGGYSYAVQS